MDLFGKKLKNALSALKERDVELDLLTIKLEALEEDKQIILSKYEQEKYENKINHTGLLKEREKNKQLQQKYDKEKYENKINHTGLLKEREKNKQLGKQIDACNFALDSEIKKHHKEMEEEAKKAQTLLQKSRNEIVTLEDNLVQVKSQFKFAQLESGHLMEALTLAQECLDRPNAVNELSLDNRAIQEKILRLHTTLPNLIDYSSVEVVCTETNHSPPLVVWRVDNYSSAQGFIPEFIFVTSIIDGMPAIALANDLHDRPITKSFFIPRLFEKLSDQQAIYRKWSSNELKRIQASVRVLDDIHKRNAENLRADQDFDFIFWESSLKSLVSDFNILPKVFLWGGVKLKRELVNLDYEHLWLEIYDLKYGNTQVPKLELRIAAANVEKNKFSRFPKLEFPLIDGKTKPFISWFGESRDDFGEKYELRFSLTDKKFDIGTFLKLSNNDQVLLSRLILNLSNIFDELIDQKISLNRSVEEWRDFISNTVQLFKNNIISLIEKKASNQTVEESSDPILEMDTVKKISKKASNTVRPLSPIKKQGISVSVIKKNK